MTLIHIVSKSSLCNSSDQCPPLQSMAIQQNRFNWRSKNLIIRSRLDFHPTICLLEVATMLLLYWTQGLSLLIDPEAYALQIVHDSVLNQGCIFHLWQNVRTLSPVLAGWLITVLQYITLYIKILLLVKHYSHTLYVQDFINLQDDFLW